MKARTVLALFCAPDRLPWPTFSFHYAPLFVNVARRSGLRLAIQPQSFSTGIPYNPWSLVMNLR
jgi:hypothetical protein